MSWDLKKKEAFTKAMGKKRPKFAKGGAVRRRHYDGGGTVMKLGGTTLGGPSTSGVSENASNPNSGFMGTINDWLGLNNNYQASSAAIQNGTTPDQLNASYAGVQDALANQGNLVNTLTPQAALAVSNQNALADQELAASRGEGPSAARSQLAEATGANVANQAALMAGQRGANANAGLMARQAAQQGASTQQQAAGQAATLRAQEQLAARERLANLSNNQISQTGQAVTGLNSAQQNEQSILQNANTSANNAKVGMQSNINNVNSQTAAANQNMAANTLGGVMSAVSSVGSMFAKGGEVDSHLKLAEMNAHSLGIHKMHYDEGGDVDAPNLGTFKAGDGDASSPSVPGTSSLPADQTDFGKDMQGGKSGGGGGGGMGGMMSLMALAADGGMITANPLMASQPMVGAANLGTGSYHPGDASGGPNIAATSGLPANKENFSKDINNMKDKSKPSGSHTQTDDEAKQGYLDADAKLGVSGVDNREDQMPASNDMDTQMVAHGGNICRGPHKSHVANYLAKGGKVPAMVSPGEVYLSPEKVREVMQEGKNPLRIGHKIPGKAKVKNDSYSNDTVPMTLEEGGVVIPRHVTNKMSAEKAELFVHRAIARKKARR